MVRSKAEPRRSLSQSHGSSTVQAYPSIIFYRPQHVLKKRPSRSGHRNNVPHPLFPLSWPFDLHFALLLCLCSSSNTSTFHSSFFFGLAFSASFSRPPYPPLVLLHSPIILWTLLSFFSLLGLFFFSAHLQSPCISPSPSLFAPTECLFYIFSLFRSVFFAWILLRNCIQIYSQGAKRRQDRRAMLVYVVLFLCLFHFLVHHIHFPSFLKCQLWQIYKVFIVFLLLPSWIVLITKAILDTAPNSTFNMIYEHVNENWFLICPSYC